MVTVKANRLVFLEDKKVLTEMKRKWSQVAECEV